jgi:hypothetical protein
MSVATKTWPLTFVPLVRMALVGALAYEFQVVLPLLVRVSLHGGAGIYGFLTSAMGAGAVAGGAGLGRPGPDRTTDLHGGRRRLRRGHCHLSALGPDV